MVSLERLRGEPIERPQRSRNLRFVQASRQTQVAGFIDSFDRGRAAAPIQIPCF